MYTSVIFVGRKRNQTVGWEHSHLSLLFAARDISEDGKMSLVARSKEKWLFSEATQPAVQNEREGKVDPSGVWRNDSFQLETFTLNILTKHILVKRKVYRGRSG